MQNVSTSALDNAQAQARTSLQAYVQNMTNPTVADVIGGKKIKQLTNTILPTGLPYRSLLIGARYGALPSGLQNKYELGFGIDILGDVNIAASFPMAKVNNHKLTLSFKPSTATDEQTLMSLLPDPSADPSQLPSSIPSYLINVTPEIAFEGEVVARGTPMRLGEELELVFQVTHVQHSPMIKTYKVAAGAYLSLSPNQGSVSSSSLQQLRAKIASTKSRLESNDPAIIGSVTREDVLGDMYHAGTLNYWAQYTVLARVASLVRDTKHSLVAGFGSLGQEPTVQYLFGFPRAITGDRVAVNVWVSDVNSDANGDSDKRRDFQFQTGMISSGLENSIPEQMYNSPNKSIQGVSAVRALEIAANQGQRIYRITPQNQRRIPWVDIVDIDIRPWRLLSKIRIVLRNDSIEARHRARELASYKVTGGRGVKDNEMVFFDFAVTEGAATTIRRLMERSLHRGTEE